MMIKQLCSSRHSTLIFLSHLGKANGVEHLGGLVAAGAEGHGLDAVSAGHAVEGGVESHGALGNGAGGEGSGGAGRGGEDCSGEFGHGFDRRESWLLWETVAGQMFCNL